MPKKTFTCIALAATLGSLLPNVAAQTTDRPPPPPPPPTSVSACGGGRGALSFAAGSSRISGIIRDGATEEPLILANITLKDQRGHYGTCSDYDGNFDLLVPKQVTELAISYIGYETLVLTLDGQTHFDVFLTPCAYPLEEVVVFSYRIVHRGGCGTHSYETPAEAAATRYPLEFSFVKNVQDAPAGTRIDTVDLYLQALNIFPNPSPASLLPRLSLDLDKERPLRMHIVDVAGRILWDTRWPTLAGTNTLEFPNAWAAWPVGTYYVVIEDEQGQKITKLVVKQ